MSEPAKINVLLIDDESEFLDATARALERRGFAVIRAETAGAALEAVKREVVDVAVIDVRLPDMDGHDLFIEIKKHHQDIQGIILTGNRNDYQRDALSHKGLFGYLDKPCEIEVLAEAVREACGSGNGDLEGEGEAVDAEGEPIRVLLIDDEQDFCESLSRLLSRRGMRVFQALSGEQGLGILEKEELDVVVIDLKMPGMSGMEVLKRMKETRPRVEAIILTGNPSIDSGVEGLREGAADVLFKPQETESLVKRIVFAGKTARKRQKKFGWWPFGGRR
jgi:DNA-binding NtrC family response regulator